MKVVLRPELLQQIRQAIVDTRKGLSENKEYRKSLFKQIGSLKLSIRAGERVCSAVVQERLGGSGYIRSTITEHQKSLRGLREQLISAEIFREIELAKFRILHAQLDKFHAPFSPSTPRRDRA